MCMLETAYATTTCTDAVAQLAKAHAPVCTKLNLATRLLDISQSCRHQSCLCTQHTILVQPDAVTRRDWGC